MPKQNPSLSAAALARVCEVLDPFDAAWRAVAQGGKPPWIEDVLNKVPPDERPVILKDLLTVELECRSAYGQQPTAEEYVARFPKFADLVAEVFQELEYDAAETTLGEESVVTKPEPAQTPEWNPRPASSQSSVEFQPGDVLRDYQLLEEIGQGGMGKVFKARHSRLRKTVALKVLAPERLRDPGALARFQREMEAVGQLRDAHVVEAYDAGEAGGVHYLVMEYVAGLDVATILRLDAGNAQKISATSLSEDGAAAQASPAQSASSSGHRWVRVADACEIIRQAALGLHHAHQQGLIHRDIKPSNLLLSSDGIVKVLDLGLARLHAEHPAGDLTSTGQVMGTVDYIAPEQIVDSHKVDLRADLYSLGCSFYHLLAGVPPFAGPSYSSAYQKMKAHENTAPPSIPRADIPSAVLAVLEKLLRKQPAERYASSAEVANALAPFANGCDLIRLVGFGYAGESRDETAVFGRQPTSEFTTEVQARPQEKLPSRFLNSTKWPSRRALLLWTSALTLLLAAAAVWQFQKSDGSAKWVATIPAAPASESIDFAAERKAAERLLALKKGRAWLGNKDRQPIGELKEPLPDQPFCILILDFDHADITDDVLSEFAGCRALDQLRLGENRKITSAGLKAMGPQPHLSELSIPATSIDDEGLLCLAGFPRLTYLNAVGSQISASGWESLPSCLQLKSLSTSSKVGDAGLRRIVEQCPELRELKLWDNSKLDISPLARLAQLEHLQVGGEVLTDTAIGTLQKLPALQQLGVNNAEALGLARLRRLETKLLWLAIGNQDDGRLLPTSDAWASVTELDGLRELHILHTIAVDAPALQRIAAMPNLRHLRIHGSPPPGLETKFRNYTAADIVAFCKARPDVLLNIDGRTDVRDRAAAEWVLSVGGTIAVRVGDERIEVTDAKQLPTREFQLIQVTLRKPQEMTQRDFERFQSLPHLEYFEAVDVAGLRDEWLSPMRGLPRLKVFKLSSGGTNDLHITDAIVPLLQTLPALEFVEFYQDGYLTDAGVAEIAKLPRLLAFGSMSPALTDNAWLAFANTPVTKLYLQAPNLTSRSVMNAAKCRNVEDLVFHSKLLKEEAISALRSCSPLRSIRIVQNVTDDIARRVATLSQLRNVFIEDGTVSDAGVAALAALPELHWIELTRVPVTDQGLQHLKSCSQLAHLTLFGTKVTPAGLAKFKAARPDVSVVTDIPEADIPPPWPLGPSEDVIPGLVARPTKLPGIKRWQVTTVASRGSVRGLAWGRHGEIAVSGVDGLIRLFDPQELRLVRVIDAHQRPSGAPTGAEILGLDWSVDGQSLMSAGYDAVRVWDRSGRLVREWKGTGATSVSWHPDGQRFAFGSASGVGVLSMAPENTEQRLSEPVGGNGARVRWSPNGEWLATSQDTPKGDTVRLWRADGKLASTLSENDSRVTSISWSPNSTKLVSGAVDGKVRVWSVSGELLATWDTKETQVHSVACHPTRPLIAASTVAGSVFLWNLDQPAEPPRRWNGGGLLIARLAWNAGGTELLAFDDNLFGLRILDEQLQPLRQQSQAFLSSQHESVAWSPKSDRLASGEIDGVLRLWSNTGLLLRTASFNNDGLHAMAWSPDAAHVVLGLNGKSAFSWLDGATRQGRPVPLPATVPYDVAWRSDGQAFAIVGPPGKLLFFEAGALPKLTNEVMAHEGDCLTVDWSAADELIATGGRDQVVRIWRPNGDRVAELEGHSDGIYDVAWSPRGDRLASCGDDMTIRLWNRDGSLKKVIGSVERPVPDMHRWGVWGLAWKPDGDRFVSCSADGTVRLWSDNGEPLVRYPAPVWEQFTGIAWTRDSKWIAARSRFNMVYVWNAETRALAWQSVLLPGGRAVTFSPAGELLTGDLHLLTNEQRTTLCIDKSDTPDLALAKSLDQTLIYILDRDDGQQELLKPSEFHRRFAEPNPKLAQPADLDRAAAEWALSIGGQVTIQHGSGSQNVSRLTELPPGVFHVVAVKFDGGDVTDEGLLKLQGLSSLTDLRLTNTPRVTPKGMQVVSSLPNLDLLILDNKSFTDDHILPLRDCLKLRHLLLNASVTDSTADVLAQLPELSYLSPALSPFTNEGLKRLLAAPKLSSIELGNQKINDEGLLLLADDPRWTSLSLGSPLTSKGIENLGRLPNLKWLGLTGNLPDGSFDVSRFPKLQALSFSRGGNDRELTADHFSWIARFQQIEALQFRYFTGIDLVGLNDLSKLNRLWSIDVESVPLTDEGLTRLVEIQSLKQMTLHNTKVTAAGLAKFKAARPDVMVEGDVGAPDPTAERAAAEWVLNRGEEVWVRVDGQDRQVRTLVELPPGPLVVTRVVLLKAEPISEEGMQRLSKLTQLEGLTIHGSPNSGELIKALPPQSRLRLLYATELPRSEGVIESLQRHPQLRMLHIMGTRWNDSDFEQLAKLRGLLQLNLYNTGLTDQRLTHIATLPELNDLNLADNPDLTAAGIRSLSALPQLRRIVLFNADESVVIAATELLHLTSLEVGVLEFTDKVIDSLSASRITKLTLNGNVPVSKWQPLNRDFCQRLSRLKQLDSLQLSFFRDSETLPKFEPGAITVLASMPQLKELVFEAVPITDNDLLALTDFKALRQLMLANTKVTPAGLTKFKAARPDVTVESDVR